MIVNDSMDGLPKNCLGAMFPTRDADAMVRIFGIAPGDRVLEVGGGFYPFARADVVTDLTFSDASNRNGAQMMFRGDKTYVECAAESLPFDDGEFDFVFCAHVLEHVADPAAAIAELGRVAKRGFVEVPSALSDHLAGNPTHRWLVTLEGGELVFRRRNYLDPPLRNFLHARLFEDPELFDLVHVQFRNLLNVQVAWEGSLPCRVLEVENGRAFDYDDARQAGAAHLLFALNLHRFGADPKYAVADAREATRYLPGDPDAWIVQGLYDARMLLLDEAIRDFRRALELRPGDPVAARNLGVVETARAEGRFDPDELLSPKPESIGRGEGPGPGAEPGPGPDSASTVGLGDPGREGPPQARPLVSVVLDAPREDARFDEMFESVVGQRYVDREILVVSRDPAADARRLERIRPSCRVEVVGVTADSPRGERLNAGCAAARGDLVAYLTDDAVWNVHHLDHLVGAVVSSGAAAAYSDALRIGFARDEDGQREYGWTGGAVLSASLKPGEVGDCATIPVANLTHRRELFAGFDSVLTELQGRDFLLRLSRSAPVEHVRRITTEYRSEVADLGSPEERARRLAEQRRLLENYSHFEPLELMRRVVELYNQNEYLRSRLAELGAT